MQIKLNGKLFFLFVFFAIAVLVATVTGFIFGLRSTAEDAQLISPFVALQENISFPLLKYSIKNLKDREYQTSEIKLEKQIAKEEKFDSYVFSYTTLDKKMTGQINIPDSFTGSPLQKHPTIVMVRGYVPEDIYATGVGTKPAAEVLANNGYITVAPDFFGYGESDDEPEDTWQTRFEKPIILIELIKSLETNGVPEDIESNLNLSVDSLGIWAHSNGGQIALTTLEILDQEIPTSLWAPVTAPFPYSILYFGDELEDEGKEQRAWIAMFEEKYDVFDFSLTKHLDLLQGPIQLHHGDADDAALIYWSREFLDKIDLENERRAELKAEQNSTTSATTSGTSTATTSATSDANQTAEMKNKPQNLEEIDITFFEYPGTNHNMVPNWDRVVARDVQFFDKYLK